MKELSNFKLSLKSKIPILNIIPSTPEKIDQLAPNHFQENKLKPIQATPEYPEIVLKDLTENPPTLMMQPCELLTPQRPNEMDSDEEDL